MNATIGVCRDCGGPARSRRNWAAIAVSFRASTKSFHTYCGRCYVFRALDQEHGGTAIRARRPYTCEGCEETQPKGSPARSFDRPANHARGLRERVRVCGECFEAWVDLYRPGCDGSVTTAALPAARLELADVAGDPPRVTSESVACSTVRLPVR